MQDVARGVSWDTVESTRGSPKRVYEICLLPYALGMPIRRCRCPDMVRLPRDERVFRPDALAHQTTRSVNTTPVPGLVVKTVGTCRVCCKPIVEPVAWRKSSTLDTHEKTYIARVLGIGETAENNMHRLQIVQQWMKKTTLDDARRQYLAFIRTHGVQKLQNYGFPAHEDMRIR